MLPREYAQLACRLVDLPHDAAPDDETLDPLFLECEPGKNTETQIIAHRQAQRFVQLYEKVSLPPPTAAALPLRTGGVYLITGGLSGIGLTLAAHLAQTVEARLVLIGRSQPTAEAQQQLDALQPRRGEAILCAQADVADRAAMQAVIHTARQRFGRIDGVIHAAGVAGGGTAASRSREQSRAVLRAKVEGTLVLDALLKDAGLDWIVYCSSLNSLLGVFGQVDYTAANAFLDAFAQHKNGTSQTYHLAINWDAWQGTGMSARAATATPPRPVATHPLLQKSRDTTTGEREFSATVTSSATWLLHEHVLLGAPTLPGTAYLDLAAATTWPTRKGTPSIFSTKVRGCRDALPSGVASRRVRCASDCRAPPSAAGDRCSQDAAAARSDRCARRGGRLPSPSSRGPRPRPHTAARPPLPAAAAAAAR